VTRTTASCPSWSAPSTHPRSGVHGRSSITASTRPSADMATLVRFGAACVHVVVDKAGAWPRHDGPIRLLLHHCVHGPRRQHQLPRRHPRQLQEYNT
jgi:hypothetical protein